MTLIFKANFVYFYLKWLDWNVNAGKFTTAEFQHNNLLPGRSAFCLKCKLYTFPCFVIIYYFKNNLNYYKSNSEFMYVKKFIHQEKRKLRFVSQPAQLNCSSLKLLPLYLAKPSTLKIHWFDKYEWNISKEEREVTVLVFLLFLLLLL